MNTKLNVAELFAGVGGFRLGLERASKSFFNTIYMNQWEPSTVVQHAYDCYVSNFGEERNTFLDNTNFFEVNKITKNNKGYINGKIDLVVGGFPCQDYSVATTNAQGIQGKKGVLWWEIEKFVKRYEPKYVLLENVDRLLKSPREQKGRDFLIMLWVFNSMGYDVEWSVINAAEYGFPQRRKRVFIFAYKRNSKISKSINYDLSKNQSVLTRNLKIDSPIKKGNMDLNLAKDLKEVSDSYSHEFFNYGFSLKGKIQSFKVEAKYNGKHIILEDILEKSSSFDADFYLNEEQLKKIYEMKDGGKKTRITKEGFEYKYSEGRMNRWDNVGNRASRTMLTSEGTVNRSTHIIKTGNRFRFITPIEAERLQGFPDNWTESMPTKRWRYFAMGNALVTNVVTEIGKSIKYFEKK